MLHIPRAQAAENELVIGTSLQGRPITAIRFGDGPRKLVVIGNTHGFPETNTYVLTTQLIEYFRAYPNEVPSDVRLYFIPTLNPDGLALGTRFNANGVDLNRNMNTNLDSCAENDWRTTVQGAYGLIADTGGPYADSEVESRIIRSFLLDASGAIFIHSNAGLVFPAFCEHAPSIAMAKAYATGASYEYSRYWPNYLITGGMHDWAGSLGIASITPELITGDQSEFEQNLTGLKAVLEQASTVLPLPEDREENGISIPALIWRYWKANGGTERFGQPLAPPQADGATTRQVFERAILDLQASQADTPYLVQPASLGRVAASGLGFPPAVDDGTGRFFPETNHMLRGAFLDAWERGGGAPVFGLPLSEIVQATTVDGQRRDVQYFERAVLALYPEDGSIRPEPLGWQLTMQEQLTAPTAPFQLR
jgi:predicted deacylase